MPRHAFHPPTLQTPAPRVHARRCPLCVDRRLWRRREVELRVNYSQDTASADLGTKLSDLVSATKSDIAAIESRHPSSTDLKVLKDDVKAIHDAYTSFDSKLKKLSTPKSFKARVDAVLAADREVEATLDKMRSAGSLSTLQSEAQEFKSLAFTSEDAMSKLQADISLPSPTGG